MEGLEDKKGIVTLRVMMELEIDLNQGNPGIKEIASTFGDYLTLDLPGLEDSLYIYKKPDGFDMMLGIGALHLRTLLPPELARAWLDKLQTQATPEPKPRGLD